MAYPADTGFKRADVFIKMRTGARTSRSAFCEGAEPCGPGGSRPVDWPNTGYEGPRSGEDDDVKDPRTARTAADAARTDKGRAGGGCKGLGEENLPSGRGESLHPGVRTGGRIGVGKALSVWPDTAWAAAGIVY